MQGHRPDELRHSATKIWRHLHIQSQGHRPDDVCRSATIVWCRRARLRKLAFGSTTYSPNMEYRAGS